MRELFENNQKDGELDIYAKELLENGNLSNVVTEILLNECVSARRHFWVEDAIDMFLWIDKYLKHNVVNLGSYEFGSPIFIDGTANKVEGSYYDEQRPIIRLCPFNSLLSNSLFNLYTYGNPGEIHYQLTKPLSYNELAESNLGVVSLDIFPFGNSDDLSANKCYIKNGLYCQERCNLSPARAKRESVEAGVYDLSGAINRNAGSRFLEEPVYPYPNARQKTPWFIEHADRIFSIKVYIGKDDRFMAEYYDNDGYHYEEIPGETLYGAYYDFMMKKGFFDEDFINREYDWLGRVNNK